MKVKPPSDRRKFANEWDEIGYLYDKVLYWFYEREKGPSAQGRYAFIKGRRESDEQETNAARGGSTEGLGRHRESRL